jgi:hypothetical protein
MPDITMCKNEQCAEKEKCYRYKATPNEYWQSYSDFKEICNSGNNYEMKIQVIKG